MLGVMICCATLCIFYLFYFTAMHRFYVDVVPMFLLAVQFVVAPVSRDHPKTTRWLLASIAICTVWSIYLNWQWAAFGAMKIRNTLILQDIPTLPDLGWNSILFACVLGALALSTVWQIAHPVQESTAK
jgi:hypothetical protein